MARTERQAPAVRAILKQTPSLVRGLSLGLWEWEWDWTVQPCWKYSRSTLFSECSRCLRFDLDYSMLKEKKSIFTEVVSKQHCLIPLSCLYLYQVDPLENVPDLVTAFYGRHEGFYWSCDGFSLTLKMRYTIIKTIKLPDMIFVERGCWRKHSIHFAQIVCKDGYWITLFSRYISTQRRD